MYYIKKIILIYLKMLFSQIPSSAFLVSFLFVSYGGKVYHSTYFIKFNRLIIRAKLMWGPHQYLLKITLVNCNIILMFILTPPKE
jgi:hypothetical protein